MSAYQHEHRLVRLSRQAFAGLAGCALICLFGNGAAGDPPCPDIVGDNLTVPNNCTYLISGQEDYATVMVKAGGTLLLGSGAELEISETLDVHAQGVFRFAASGGGGPQPILRASDSLEISGLIQTTSGGDRGGAITADASAFVILTTGAEITSEFGPIVITADFVNDGTVTANGGTAGFDITFTGAIASGSTGLFQVTAANSDMIFNHSAALTITGGADFNVEAGLMKFEESVETDGGYRQIGGKIRAAAGETFKATGAYP